MANHPSEHGEHGGGASTSTSSVHVDTRESGAGKKKKNKQTPKQRRAAEGPTTHRRNALHNTGFVGGEEGAGSRYATRNTKSVFVISDDKKSRRDVKANGAKQSVYSYSGSLVGRRGEQVLWCAGCKAEQDRK